MKRKLKKGEKDAVRNRYGDNTIFRVLKASSHFESRMGKFRLSPEDVFYNCFDVLDDIKQNPDDAVMNVDTLWDDIYNDFRDWNIEGAKDEDIRLGTSIVIYCVALCLLHADEPPYSTIVAHLMGQLQQHGASTEDLQQTFWPNIYRIGTENFSSAVNNYLEDDDYWADEMAEIFENGKDDVPEITQEGDNTQFTNRQLMILFEALLNVTLAPASVKVSPYTEFIHRVTGKSARALSNVVSPNGLEYDKDEVVKDANYVASSVEKLLPQIAESIRGNIMQ